MIFLCYVTKDKNGRTHAVLRRAYNSQAEAEAWVARKNKYGIRSYFVAAFPVHDA